MSTHDPITLAQSFDAAWNAHDMNAVMGFFADDAIVRLAPPPPDGGIYSGKAAIRAWAETLMPGFHVESTAHCATGDQVTWSFRVSCDSFQAMGVNPVTGRADALVRGDKIKSFTVTFDEATASRMSSA
jgi:ketosteroid isomerase-like protein